MTPTRAGSGIGQLIWQLCKAEKLPEPWTPNDLTNLIRVYRELIEAIEAGEDSVASPDEDDLMQHGRPGAYEAMVARAHAREKARKRVTQKHKKGS